MIVNPSLVESNTHICFCLRRKSKVSDNTMDSFRANTLSGDITEVPGIGKAGATRLREEGIHNTYQLLGHYMKLAEVATSEEDGEPSIDTYMLNQQFWHFLKGAQITAHRSAIVKAVSDKVAASFPAFHDANIYDDEE